MWAGVRSDQNRQDSVRQAATPGKTSKVFAGYDICNSSSSLPSGGFSWDNDHAQESSTKWPEPDDMVFLGDVPPNCLNSEKFSHQHLLNRGKRTFLSESSVCDFHAPSGLWDPVLLRQECSFQAVSRGKITRL